jgi:hypothetical protein
MGATSSAHTAAVTDTVGAAAQCDAVLVLRIGFNPSFPNNTSVGNLIIIE